MGFGCKIIFEEGLPIIYKDTRKFSPMRRPLDTRLLVKRGIDESRHESRARHRHRRGFFCDSCSNLEIDENFQISHKLGIDIAK